MIVPINFFYSDWRERAFVNRCFLSTVSAFWSAFSIRRPPTENFVTWSGKSMIYRNTINKIKLLFTNEKLLCIPEDNSTKLKQFFIPWAVYLCIWALTLLVDWNLRNPNNPLEGGLGSFVLGGIYNLNFFFFIIITLWAAFRFQNKISRFIFFFIQIGIAYILTIWILMIYAVEYVGDTI